MAAYVDWMFYSNEYQGTDIAEANFTRLSTRASAVVDLITFNRVAAIIEEDSEDDADDIEKIKLAVCAVADEMQKQSETGPVVSSERVGNLSRTYVVDRTMKKTERERLSDEASIYLSSTGLMFKGFADGEYGGISDDD